MKYIQYMHCIALHCVVLCTAEISVQAAHRTTDPGKSWNLRLKFVVPGKSLNQASVLKTNAF